MTAFDRFDPFEQRIADALGQIAPARRPGYLDDILAVTARTSQRPRWTFPERWLRTDTAVARTGPLGRLAGRPVMLLVLLALLVAAIGFGIVALSRVDRPSLKGVLDPTGTPLSAMFEPAGVALRDGRVLVVGATADLRLDAEVYDPATGRFSAVAGVAPRVFNEGRGLISLVPLADGGALIVVAPMYSQSGRTFGGYALRLEAGGSEVRTTLGWRAGADPRDGLALFSFAEWAWARLPDGRVRWTSPEPWHDDTSVVYDPAADAFAVETGAAPAEPTGPAVSLALPGGRYLWFAAGEEGRTIVTVDAASRSVVPMDWPVDSGVSYTGTRLPDGRILVLSRLGGANANEVFDPRSGTLQDLGGPTGLRFQLRLPDGRILLDRPDQDSFGGSAAEAWILDPASTSLVGLGSRIPDANATYVHLGDDRVLVVGGDVNRSLGPGAWILR